MGKYYEWADVVGKGLAADVLIEHLYKLDFKYHIIIDNHSAIGPTIRDHDEISKMTTDEWTGFFNPLVGTYVILFKNESDAVAAKLRWV